MVFEMPWGFLGQTSAPVAVQAGTSGLIEADLQQYPGGATSDDSVTWASLGNTAAIGDGRRLGITPSM